jgi:hypothetical protein
MGNCPTRYGVRQVLGLPGSVTCIVGSVGGKVHTTQKSSSLDIFSSVLIFPISVIYHRNMVSVEGFLADPDVDLTRYKRHEVHKRYVTFNAQISISLTKYAAFQFST